MPRVSDTDFVRAVLREWAEDAGDASRARRAHQAYVSTQSNHDGFFVILDEEMLQELRLRVRVQELADGDADAPKIEGRPSDE
jgi:hypothetical protein